MELLVRNEVLGMSEHEVKKIALEKIIDYKGFNSYIFKCFNGSFEELNSMTFYNGKFIDYITYPDYVVNIKGLENYVKYVEKCLKEHCFNVDELETIKSYNDYRNKKYFVYNIYYQILGGKTVYSNIIDVKIYKYKASIFLFQSKIDIDNFITAVNRLSIAFDKKMKNKAFFKSAVKYEMFNHETPIDWEGWTPALNSLGVDYEKLSIEFKYLVQDAFKEVSNAVSW